MLGGRAVGRGHIIAVNSSGSVMLTTLKKIKETAKKDMTCITIRPGQYTGNIIYINV